MDKKAPQGLRSSVQGFFTFLTYGGWLIGSYLTGIILQKYQIADESGIVTGHKWPSVMVVPAGIAVIVILFFTIFFRDNNMNGQNETNT